ncbi:hypothetical protein GCM10023321_60680 [Pseudonocardia eucalypti]|uniref:HTH tetR-type domain-containing protein n=1 Tax=Pseudonocardia eucalypti TaxID=648755 RepID=A0ABP9QU96_9PSEU|nr:AcrR family transcriptional regulator [Pseudonocardia eucalypti]
MPRPKQRTPELRDRLLRAAIDTLTDGGIAGFTTRRVAAGAETSVPAVYELFGDKAGLAREIFFEGFRRLGGMLRAVPDGADPRHDLVCTIDAFREFVRHNPELVEVMFGRPFADFDPGRGERAAGDVVRETLTGRVRRCVEAGELDGDPTDLAHVLIAVAQGLARQEVAGWLGVTEVERDRRWSLAFERVLRAP